MLFWMGSCILLTMMFSPVIPSGQSFIFKRFVLEENIPYCFVKGYFGTFSIQKGQLKGNFIIFPLKFVLLSFSATFSSQCLYITKTEPQPFDCLFGLKN